MEKLHVQQQQQQQRRSLPFTHDLRLFMNAKTCSSSDALELLLQAGHPRSYVSLQQSLPIQYLHHLCWLQAQVSMPLPNSRACRLTPLQASCGGQVGQLLQHAGMLRPAYTRCH